jgi:hypothetical protein
MRMILGRKKHRRFTVYALGRWILTSLMACTQRTRPDTTGHDRAIYFQISAIGASATPKKVTNPDGWLSGDTRSSWHRTGRQNKPFNILDIKRRPWSPKTIRGTLRCPLSLQNHR